MKTLLFGLLLSALSFGQSLGLPSPGVQMQGVVISRGTTILADDSPVVQVTLTPNALGLSRTSAATATLNFPDGTSTDITSQAFWASSNTAVATIPNNVGTATTIAAGTTSISASYLNFSGSALLTVTLPPNITNPVCAAQPCILPAGTNGTAYAGFTFTQTGGSGCTWAVSAGTLPTGLSLSSGGAISGTPTVSGTQIFTVTPTCSGGSASVQVSITISNPAGLAARTDLCVLGFASDATNCTSGKTTGQARSAMIFRNQSSDPRPFSQLAPANTAFTGQDFNAYTVIATDTALASSAGISAGAIFNLGTGGHFWAKDNSLLLVNTGGGNTLLLWVDVTGVHNKTCSTIAPCLRYTGIRTSGTTQDATHFTNPVAMSYVLADPANTIFELSSSGLVVNKLTVNGLPGCATSASCTLTRTAYVNFASDSPVNCSVLPSDYQQKWIGLFNPANDGSVGFPMGGAGNWHSTTTYTLNDVNSFIIPTSGNAGTYGFQATVSGTTGGAAPAWCQTSGCTVADGTVTWQNIGKVNGQGPGFDLVTYKPGHGCSHLNTRLGKIARGTGNADPAGTLTTDSPSSAWNLYGSTSVPVALTDAGTLHDAQLEMNSTYMQFTLTGAGGAPSSPFTGKQSCRSSGGAENYCYMHFWEMNTLTVRPCQEWTNQGTNTIGQCDAHGLPGQQGIFKGGAFFYHLYNNPNTSAGAPNPGTKLLPNPLSWDQHGSWNNVDALDSSLPLMAMDQVPSVGRVNGSGYTSAWYNEDGYIKPDGSGTFYRISHNYNTGSSPDFSTQSGFAVTSPDGTFMAVASDMMETRGAVASPTSQCTSNRADFSWSKSSFFASGIRVLPVSNNSNQSIFINNGAAGQTGTVGNFAACQTLSSTCVDGSITWTNLGPNGCRGDIFVVDVLSAHPLP